MERGVLLILLSAFLILSLSYVSAVRINEVELNPDGGDSGNEWIELYSEQEINITDWIILSTNGRNMTFNASFSDYWIINTPYNLLTNDNNRLSLINSTGDIIFGTANLSDSLDDNRTWQFCNNSWIFINGTKNLTNFCVLTPINTSNPKATQNTTANQIQIQEIIISLDYDSEIYNNEEFDVKVETENLEDADYDIKIFLEYDDKIISEIYDEEDEKWKSGNYYVYNVLLGPGEDSNEFSLRLNKNNVNFTGKAKIYARLRKSSSSSYEEESDTVKFIKKAEKQSIINNINNSSIASINKAEGIIKLEGKDIKSYKSRSEYIKEYSVYGFTLFLVILMLGLIVWRKNKINSQI